MPRTLAFFLYLETWLATGSKSASRKRSLRSWTSAVPRPRKQKLSSEAQRTRFIETARAIGADEDEAAFKAKLGVIARQKPKDEPAPKTPKAKS
jgi:hypothetical protein